MGVLNTNLALYAFHFLQPHLIPLAGLGDRISFNGLHDVTIRVFGHYNAFAIGISMAAVWPTTLSTKIPQR